jgi:MOSC domain-containing protein YiiM
MQARNKVIARADHGPEGDAHARPGGRRQVLLLDAETLEEFALTPGALKENITTVGVSLRELEPGQRLRVGEALLEVSMECAPCQEVEKLGRGLQEAINGRRGILARVLEGGPIHPGDTVRLLTR